MEKVHFIQSYSIGFIYLQYCITTLELNNEKIVHVTHYQNVGLLCVPVSQWMMAFVYCSARNVPHKCHTYLNSRKPCSVIEQKYWVMTLYLSASLYIYNSQILLRAIVFVFYKTINKN